MKEPNTPFHLILKLTRVYRACEGIKHCESTTIAAKCEIEALVWGFFYALDSSHGILTNSSIFPATPPSRIRYMLASPISLR